MIKFPHPASLPKVSMSKKAMAARLRKMKPYTVIRRKTMDCAICGKLADCASLPGPRVEHRRVWVWWICSRCWETERRRRRDYNKKRGLTRSDPTRLVCYPWPKRFMTEPMVFPESD